MPAPELLRYRNLASPSSSPVFSYALEGANLLLLYPVPSVADTLTLYYTPVPTAMANASDDPSTATYGGIPTVLHRGIELFALWKMADEMDDAGSQQGASYRQMYEGPGGFLTETRKYLRDLGGSQLGPATMPPRGRRVYVPNPGVDLPAAGFYS